MVVKILHKCMLEKDGKILLLKRSDNDTLGGKWDFAGGNIEALEKSEDCVRREVLEESGLRVFDIERIGIDEVIIKKNKRHYIVFYYSGKVKSSDVVLSNEHSDFKWVKKKDLFKVRDLHPFFRMSKDLKKSTT